jgi:hypothetical protein
VKVVIGRVKVVVYGVLTSALLVGFLSLSLADIYTPENIDEDEDFFFLKMN